MQSKLIKALITKGLLKEEEAKHVLAEATRHSVDPDEYLRDKNLISEKELVKVQGELYGLPFVDLERTEVPYDILIVIPQTVAENYQLVVFEKKGNDVSVALVHPNDYRAIEAINFWAKEEGFTLHLHVTTQLGFQNAVKNYSPFRKEIGEAIESLEAQRLEESRGERKGKLIEIIRKAPVARIVSLIISEAVNAGASDIHMEPGVRETRIRYRIDGILHVYLTLPFHLHSSLIARIKVLANLKMDETRIPQDGRIKVTIDGRDINLRVSTLPVSGNEKVVMRILPTETKTITLEQLGFIGKTLDILKGIIARPTGVVLVSGPTGSGKSTTLSSIVGALNKETVNIITLEDPVEYYIPGINQVQINPDVGLTFASGLRAVLRQDPNVVMVGEIRDNETAELAIHAALTGHFMLSTIHAKDVMGVIPRLTDMHVEPFLISAAVNTLISQRLVRLLCQKCKKTVTIPQGLEKEVSQELDHLPDPTVIEKFVAAGKKLVFYRSEGCDNCGGTGYKGRSVVAEAFQMTESVQNALTGKYSIDDLAKEMKKQGNMTLKQDAIVKALQGLTSLEEVLRVTRE
ncbi:type II/IV secretion system protein [Candidatus Uhrbacteria bacterium]|nr:type II/IV secretion system protein [Candidatus Uhrbacteria bacterium]